MKKKISSQAPRLSQREPIRLQRRPPSLAKLDMTKHMGRKEYETKLARLQVSLKELSLAYQSQSRRAVIVLEGWDAAGKGGVIRRMHWPLDPRGLKVWPISAPTPEELDLTVGSKAHDVKDWAMWYAEAEDWLFALVTRQAGGGYDGTAGFRCSSVATSRGMRTTRSSRGSSSSSWTCRSP